MQERGLLLKKGAIVDSPLISALSSTKNAEKRRDSEAHSTKAHIGVNQDTGLVHTLKVTAPNVHDVTMMAQLLSGEETIVHGDSGYPNFQLIVK